MSDAGGNGEFTVGGLSDALGFGFTGHENRGRDFALPSVGLPNLLPGCRLVESHLCTYESHVLTHLVYAMSTKIRPDSPANFAAV